MLLRWMEKIRNAHIYYFPQLVQLKLMSSNKSYKYSLKRVKCAFSHICNSSKVHHSIKLILWKYFINLITSQVDNFSGAFSNNMLQSKLKFNTRLFLVTRKDYKDTDFASPKSAYINWSLPGSGYKSWRTLTAPRFPLERLSCKRENLFSTD